MNKRASIEYSFLTPPTTTSMDDQESVTTANGVCENGDDNANNSVTLYVYEPKTGRTSTQLYTDHKKRISRMSCRERFLCTYSTITTLALLCTVTLFLLHATGVKFLSELTTMSTVLSPSEEICLTPECVVIASQMLSKINATADRCDDFYEFSCGRWNDESRIPAGYMFWSTLNELTFTTFEALRNEYEKPTLEWTEAERKAVSVYRSCMDTDSIAKNGVEPLRRLIGRLGGWSLVNPNMVFTNWSLGEELNKMFAIGLLPVIWVGAVMDDKNTSRHVIGLDQAQITLRSRDQYLDLENGNRTLYMNETPLAWLKNWVAYTGLLLGADPILVDQRADRIVEFEARLAQLSPKRKHAPSLYRMTSLKELQEVAPVLDWRRFLGNIFYNANVEGDDEPILVYGWDWLRDLNALLIEYTSSEEGRRTIDDYMKWCAAYRLTPTLDRGLFNDSVSPLYKFLLGLITSPPRWLECAMQTEAMMSLAVSSLYIKLRGSTVFDVRRRATRLVKEMLDEIRTHLRHVAWMDEPTRIRALKKVENIVSMVGFSNEFLDPAFLNNLYKFLSVKDDEYFDNTLAAFRFTRRTVVNLLRQNPSRSQWDASIAPVQVNAYYGFPLNRVVFPLALLQNPVFNIKGPMTINYAMIGSIIGHELVHAFDDTGKEYDETGSLGRWWSPLVYQRSAIRGQCLVEQYNNYSFDGIQLDGARTLNENVADFDGLNIAYKAFKRSLNTQRHFALPGLNMTSEQLFFLSYAQLWCQKAANQQFRRYQMLVDSHSVEKYRVQGPLSNFAPFAESFRCPSASNMNPVTKCHVH